MGTSKFSCRKRKITTRKNAWNKNCSSFSISFEFLVILCFFRLRGWGGRRWRFFLSCWLHDFLQLHWTFSKINLPLMGNFLRFFFILQCEFRALSPSTNIKAVILFTFSICSAMKKKLWSRVFYCIFFE